MTRLPKVRSGLVLHFPPCQPSAGGTHSDGKRVWVWNVKQ